MAYNVKAWRSAGHSIPSARLTNVDFYLKLKLRLIAQLKSVRRNRRWHNGLNAEGHCSSARILPSLMLAAVA
jgi:hypothetical protein